MTLNLGRRLRTGSRDITPAERGVKSNPEKALDWESNRQEPWPLFSLPLPCRLALEELYLYESRAERL